MQSLHLVTQWPVDHVAAAVVRPRLEPVTIGDPERSYRLASISKVVTAWTVLIAVEEGTVSLDDPVGQPGCTLRHLLSHAGGYPFDGADPIAPPGQARIYSNSGIELAVETLERASGLTFETYLSEAVLAPLGMTSTALRGSPAHAIWSTLVDTTRFAGELLRPRLLAPETAAEAARPQYPELSGIVPGVGRFSPCPWGLGAEIAGDKQPHWTGRVRSPAAFGHFGGAGTMLLVDPVAECAIVALTDRAFDEWADEAIRSWAELCDAVLEEVAA